MDLPLVVAAWPALWRGLRAGRVLRKRLGGPVSGYALVHLKTGPGHVFWRAYERGAGDAPSASGTVPLDAVRAAVVTDRLEQANDRICYVAMEIANAPPLRWLTYDAGPLLTALRERSVPVDFLELPDGPNARGFFLAGCVCTAEVMGLLLLMRVLLAP